MISIDTARLNPLERHVLETIAGYAKDHPRPTIVEAAQRCGCSVSHVSKAIKKAGFAGYKRYMDYLYTGEQPRQETHDEIERLKRVLETFDVTMVDDFVELVRSRSKIVVFGYGPSHVIAQYLEYKLRLCLDAVVTTPPDEDTLRSLLGPDTLLIILTATGRYRSFHDVASLARSRDTEVVVVSEEYNSVLMEDCRRYIVLANENQPDDLKPYQKTRTLFLVFFEQVILKLLGR
ncbi:MAG: MurR/RpiR family transcriptional regulator [Alkalispirochaeta sp.]